MILRIVLMLLLFSATALAHDKNRPELNDWFMNLHAKSGASCCDASEATRLDDVDWDAKDGHYRVRLNGQWFDVPPEAIVEGPNRAGPTMVWPWFGPNGYTIIRCFMPGSMT